MREKTFNMDYLNKGIYTYSDISKLLGMSKFRIKGFIKGHKYKDRPDRKPVVVDAQNFIFDDKDYFTFLDLIELKFIQHFLNQGLKRNDIIKAYYKIKEEFKLPRPFATICVSDSKTIFLDNKQVLLNPKDRQLWFRELSKSSLLEGIDFENDLAVRWYPNKKIPEIVIDPCYKYGKPIIKGQNIKTETLYRAFLAEDENTSIISNWFEIPEDLVIKAVNFERGLTA